MRGPGGRLEPEVYMFKRFTLLLSGLVLATACTAATTDAPEPYTNGNEYVTLPNPVRDNKEGKVEVVEVFSYGCVHCAHFEPYAENIQKQLPAGVVFRSVPAVFNDAWAPYARAFYAAQKLGALNKTHAALFKAIHEDHYPIRTMDELGDFYARNGVDREAFMKIAQSDEVTQKIISDTKLIQAWQVEGTPTIIVNGKYVSKNITSFDQLAAMTQWLVKRELATAK
jgi:protein dithiol oxidoreductase (disulfide-forming)